MTLIDSEHHQKMTVCQETSQAEAKGFALCRDVKTHLQEWLIFSKITDTLQAQDKFHAVVSG